MGEMLKTKHTSIDRLFLHILPAIFCEGYKIFRLKIRNHENLKTVELGNDLSGSVKVMVEYMQWDPSQK